ncbi:cytochrome P450 6B5-like [Polyergus mexicanus]|uniref:cytochrome P450 6B5-like n=1 Tax=Polyergus mexicanus TaxID=615972 RepID=UPI0038B499B1
MTEIFEILCVIILFLCAIYYYYTFKFDFWKKRKVVGPKPVLFFGTVKDVILRRTSFMEYYKSIYMAYKDAPLVGIFNQTMPILMINDFSLIKEVTTNVGVFSWRGIKYSKKAESISHNLLLMNGEVPLQLRARLSPVFTPSKLKNIFPLLLQRSEIFNNWLDTLLSQNEEVDCKKIITRLVVDYTTTCMFGYDITNIEDLDSEIIQYIKKYTDVTTLKNMFKMLLPDFVIYNKIYDLIGYYLFDNREITEHFKRFVKNIVDYRKKHDIFKHDIANIFIELKQKKFMEKTEFTDDFFVAQMMTLFIAGYESSTATISNTLYELALNHNIQNRLRKEIRNLFTKNNGELTFENIMTMPYLDAVYKETLRKYPVADIITRQSSTAYTFKNSEVTIPKDQLVIIPIYGIHFNSKIYPKPEIYDPERFIGEEAPSRQAMHFIPFGHGPRNCIGERFGILQVKMGLINIVRNYKIDLCEKTHEKICRVKSFVQQLEHIYLKISKID